MFKGSLLLFLFLLLLLDSILASLSTHCSIPSSPSPYTLRHSSLAKHSWLPFSLPSSSLPYFLFSSIAPFQTPLPSPPTLLRILILLRIIHPSLHSTLSVFTSHFLPLILNFSIPQSILTFPHFLSLSSSLLPSPPLPFLVHHHIPPPITPRSFTVIPVILSFLPCDLPTLLILPCLPTAFRLSSDCLP